MDSIDSKKVILLYYRIYLIRSHADDTQFYALLTFMYSENNGEARSLVVEDGNLPTKGCVQEEA